MFQSIKVKLWTLLGTLLFSIAYIKLFQDGFGVGFHTILPPILTLFSSILDIIKQFISYIFSLFGWKIEMAKHWISIFSLMMIYFSRDVINSFKTNPRKRTSIFHLFLGIIIALITSILTSTIPILSQNFWINIQIVSLPILGLFLYSIFGIAWTSTCDREFFMRDARAVYSSNATWWQAFQPASYEAFKRTIGGLLIAAILLFTGLFEEQEIPSLAVLYILVIFFAIYWLYKGINHADENNSAETSLIKKNRYTKVGIAMFTGIGMKFLLIAVDYILL